MNLFRSRWFQLATLTAFFAAIGIQALRLKFCVLDYDIWWHLKVGDWILDHAALPHTGILSRTAANLPWVAYSWGYEVLLSRAYAWFGLMGIGICGVVLTLGVALSIYWMLRRLSGRFWVAAVLGAVTCHAFLFNGMPRPVFFSQMLFCVTLTLLFEAQRSGGIRPLYWLPLVFLLWANLHIQFVYGIFAVGLFVAVNLALRLLSSRGYSFGHLVRPALPTQPLLVILGLCALATVLGPNFYHPYLVVLAYTKAKFTYAVIVELQPLTFRVASNFVELFLAAAAFYAVGWQKKLDVFKLALLLVASVVAFRTMRDGWFICLSAAACLADFPAPEESQERAASWTEIVTVAAAVFVLLFLAAPATNFNTRELDRAISANFPVNAINFLRRNPVPGPLYNNLSWGGFLMWYLPELPVAVDGRNDLYGDDLDRLFYQSESAFPSYATDPYLDEAGVVVLDSHLPLAKILSIDPRFRLVFHDEIATVYARSR
ncbi:MAG TPA: hypothetical protein VEI54_07995 [Candidatus Limnocylindrales bacterium]|nr:hypothetical protein [Candidatus Limnocylindrales bacterium]